MKLIIAGSRTISDKELVYQIIDNYPGEYFEEVLCGGAKGLDIFAYRWALARGRKVTVYPAKWEMYGSAAGPIRNQQMAIDGDALLAIMDGETKGTRNMIEQVVRLKKPYKVVNIRDHMKGWVCPYCRGLRTNCEYCGKSGFSPQCSFCGFPLVLMRPGKWQCSNCD